MISFSKPSTFKRGATDHFRLYSLSEFVADAKSLSDKGFMASLASDHNWSKCNGVDHALEMLEYGDSSLVERSEDMLSKIEHLLPPASAAHRIVDDVTGAVPNVGAFLAGQPMNMRRKIKRDSDAAPVRLVMNLGSSAMVNASDVEKRGIALLALTRAISARRPVELWLGVTSQGATPNSSASAFFQVETTPLDLQRAAHLVAGVSVSRVAAYPVLHHKFGTPRDIPWAYAGDGQASYSSIVQNGFGDDADTVAIPSLYGRDEMVAKPVEWLTKKMAVLFGEDMEDAA